MDVLSGRVAVVTGGGAGIGRSIVLALADAGVHIVVADIDAPAGEAVCAEAAARGVRAIACPTDVANLDDVRALAERAYREFDRVDILVNNAGVSMRPFRAVWDMSYEDYKWIFDTNMWGVINCTHIFVPYMQRQSGEKAIVNQSSVGTLWTVPGHSAYVAAKSAVNGYSDVIREELADDGFMVTTVFGGNIPTGLGDSERRRPEKDRSTTRGVPSYHTYVQHKPETERGVDPKIAGGTVYVKNANEALTPLDVDLVGPIIVQAIRDRVPYCMTHPSPTVALRERAEALIAASRPLPSVI